MCYNYSLMKLTITISVLIFSTLGGLIGQYALDNGNFLGGWSMLLGTVGGILGVWIGYKVYQNYL